MSARRVLLVVENDVDLSNLVKLTFKTHPDFIVDGHASSATTAIERAGTIAPDLIVLDHFLDGDQTGLDVARQLKEVAPGCRIILFSASEQPREAAMDSPYVDAFVLKTNVGSLVARARQVLGSA